MLSIERLALIITLVVAVIAAAVFQTSRAGGQVEGVVNRVLDGDTVYVGPTNIRLQGIAAEQEDRYRLYQIKHRLLIERPLYYRQRLESGLPENVG